MKEFKLEKLTEGPNQPKRDRGNHIYEGNHILVHIRYINLGFDIGQQTCSAGYVQFRVSNSRSLLCVFFLSLLWQREVSTTSYHYLYPNTFLFFYSGCCNRPRSWLGYGILCSWSDLIKSQPLIFIDKNQRLWCIFKRNPKPSYPGEIISTKQQK